MRVWFSRRKGSLRGLLARRVWLISDGDDERDKQDKRAKGGERGKDDVPAWRCPCDCAPKDKSLT